MMIERVQPCACGELIYSVQERLTNKGHEVTQQRKPLWKAWRVFGLVVSPCRNELGGSYRKRPLSPIAVATVVSAPHVCAFVRLTAQ